MSWTTPAAVRAYMGSTSGSNDAQIQALIDGCSAFIETWTNRTYLQASYSETVDGNGKDELMLANYPVSAVSAVSINGQAFNPVPVPNDFVSVGFMFDKQVVTLQGAIFGKGRKNVTINYTAGYASIPLDLVQACIETVALKLKQGPQAGLQSKGLAGETTTYVISDFPKSVISLLNNYKRVVPHA